MQLKARTSQPKLSVHFPDIEPPKLTCPTGSIEFNNDPGKNVATVTWSFDFTDNSLTANEPGVTKDKFTVVLTIDSKETSTTLPKLVTIGKHPVHYSVTDLSGNSQSCSFDLIVKGNVSILRRLFFRRPSNLGLVA